MDSRKEVVEMNKAQYDRLKSIVVWYDQMPINIESDSFDVKMDDLMNDLIPEIPGFDEDDHYRGGLEVNRSGEMVFDVCSSSTGDTEFEVVLVPHVPEEQSTIPADPIRDKALSIIDRLYAEKGPAYTAGFLTSVVNRLITERVPESQKNNQLLEDLFGDYVKP